MKNDRTLVDDLRRDIISGKMTSEDIGKKLTIAIEKAYLSESPNMEFIEACENLLWEIGTKGEQKFLSPTPAYLKVMEKKAKRTGAGRASIRIAKRCALASAVAVLALALTQGTLHFGRFEKEPSLFEQEYIIQGYSTDIDLMPQGVAEDNGITRMETENWDELTEYLGFTPSIVNPEALGASSVQYSVIIDPTCTHVGVAYREIDGGGVAVMTIDYFASAEDLRISVQQDADGVTRRVDGIDVYVTTNLTRATSVWRTGLTVYVLSGDIDTTQAFEYAVDVIRGR